MTQSEDLIEALKPFLKAVFERKALDVVVLDVRELTSVADVFIICSGQSSRQVMAIAETIRSELRNRKIKPSNVEGISEGHWVLLDYGHIIYHIFYEPIRAFYDLEGLWTDARRIATDVFIRNRE